jgi:hypothetical protein
MPRGRGKPQLWKPFARVNAARHARPSKARVRLGLGSPMAAFSEASGFGNAEILGHPERGSASAHTPEGRRGRGTLGARGRQCPWALEERSARDATHGTGSQDPHRRAASSPSVAGASGIRGGQPAIWGLVKEPMSVTLVTSRRPADHPLRSRTPLCTRAGFTAWQALPPLRLPGKDG